MSQHQSAELEEGGELQIPDSMTSIYRNRKQVDYDGNTAVLFKRAVKEEMWPEYKFFSLEQVNMIDVTDVNSILHKILKNLNMERETDLYKATFFNTYGRLIPETIAAHRGSTLSFNKKQIFQGKHVLCGGNSN